LRIVDSLQTGDKHRITTPINWVPGKSHKENAIAHDTRSLCYISGDDVIVHPSVKGDEAAKLFPKMNIVKPYLRFTPLPKDETSASA